MLTYENYIGVFPLAKYISRSNTSAFLHPKRLKKGQKGIWWDKTVPLSQPPYLRVKKKGRGSLKWGGIQQRKLGKTGRKKKRRVLKKTRGGNAPKQ